MSEHTAEAISNTVAESFAAAAGVTVDDEVEKLRSVNPNIAKHFPTWNDIDDVLEADLTRQTKSVKGIAVSMVIEKDKSGHTQLFPFHREVTRTEFIHLPRGSMEPFSEYEKRVRLTPFFPETPNIVDNRRGALFAKEPEIKVNDLVQPFLETIGTKRQSYREILDFIAWRTYAYGIVAVFIDFRRLPEDVKLRMLVGEQISEAEMEDRRLNQPVIAVFNERQILDFQFNRQDGRMDWIKLRTTFMDRKSWDDPGKLVENFRIIDRKNINIFEVREVMASQDQIAEVKITNTEVIPHGTLNASGDPEVPVTLVRPFLGRDEIGQSPIKLSVEADLAAARLLSDILFNLHVHGSPIVTFTTPDQTGERAASLEWGTTRYLQLQSFPEAQGIEAETIDYLQLDTSGTQLLIDQWEALSKKANELANRTSPNAATDPVPMSGVAKQWDFKTGEEKALNEHIHALQMASDEILKMLTRILINNKVIAADSDKAQEEVRTSFDPSFELGNPDMNIELVDKIVKLAKDNKLIELESIALERALSSIPNLKDTERRDILTEIDERKEKKVEAKEGGDGPEIPKAPGVPPPPPSPPPNEIKPSVEGEPILVPAGEGA